MPANRLKIVNASGIQQIQITKFAKLLVVQIFKLLMNVWRLLVARLHATIGEIWINVILPYVKTELRISVMENHRMEDCVTGIQFAGWWLVKMLKTRIKLLLQMALLQTQMLYLLTLKNAQKILIRRWYVWREWIWHQSADGRI